MDLNTCFETTQTYHTTAYYSHLVPIVLGLFLSIYAVIKTKGSTLSLLFFGFVASFSLWLVGDLVNWVVSDYYWVYLTWSWLDFLGVTFFILGAYFFGILARERISIVEKLAFLVILIPAFVVTVSGNSIVGFDQTFCEAFSNEWLSHYKLYAEGAIVLMMLYSLIAAWKGADVQRRIQLGVIFLAMVFFFGIFAGTDFIASSTGVYEINLYGMFVLPLFLIVLTFAITDLKLFQFRFVGTQILAYVLVIMVGSQLLYIQDSATRTLSLVTLAISFVLGVLLIENARREASARVKIEDLAKQLAAANDRLKELDQMKSEFLSIASHQLRAPITAVRGYAANLLEGEYGSVPDNLKEPLGTVQESARLMANSIEDYLNISRIEQGRMKYEKSDFDIADIAKKVVTELGPLAVKKKLSLQIDAPQDLTVSADIGKIKQVITNLVDNAIKYTEQGSVSVKVEKVDIKARVTIQDTGVGLSPEDIGGLFEKFKRARGANKVNTTGTGLGLYVAKQLVEGNGGKVWVESDGPGKGSRFIFELPAK